MKSIAALSRQWRGPSYGTKVFENRNRYNARLRNLFIGRRYASGANGIDVHKQMNAVQDVVICCRDACAVLQTVSRARKQRFLTRVQCDVNAIILTR